MPLFTIVPIGSKCNPVKSFLTSSLNAATPLALRHRIRYEKHYEVRLVERGGRIYQRIYRYHQPTGGAMEKAFETVTATAMIIDGVGASAAQIANGLVSGLGDADAGQLAGAQETGQAPSIALVGFEGRTRLLGNERRSGDQTGDFELLEATRDTKTAGPGFVSDL